MYASRSNEPGLALKHHASAPLPASQSGETFAPDGRELYSLRGARIH